MFVYFDGGWSIVDGNDRLALDAAVRKMNSSKKENRALEDDVETAQAR